MVFSGDEITAGWVPRGRQVSTQLTKIGQVVSSLFARIQQIKFILYYPINS